MRAFFAIAAVLCAGAARADAVEDFYRGRVVTLVVGSAEGGQYDTTARLMARWIGKFLPGHPTVIVQNMPGASSVRAYQWLYTVAPKDGATLGFVQPTVVLNRLTDATAAYEPEKFTVIGRFDPITTFGTVWHTSGVTSIEDARQREVFMSASSAIGAAAFIPWTLNRLVGTKFKVVRGYENEAATTLAMERGETQGVGSSTIEYMRAKADWFAQKKVRIIYTIALQRHPGAPDAPTIVELAKNDADRQVLELLASVSTIGRVLYAPPNVPADRAAALRKAFETMLKDRDFLADAARVMSEPDPLPAADVLGLIERDMKMPREVVERTKQVIEPMD
jgi:tripartite-type tricarboxylate transporter receptor subunit TctC